METPISFLPDGAFYDEEKGHYEKGSFDRKDLPPGTARFLKDQDEKPDQALMFVCPCGCGNVSSIRITTGPKDTQGEWQWNGNTEKPTLTPSIQKLTDCRWHGYLTDGIFRSC